MKKITERDLNFVIDNGIIEVAYIQEYIQRMKREEILKQHSRKISQGKDGKWRTYIDDDTHPKGFRMIKRTTKKGIEDAIVEYYKGCQNKALTFKDMYFKWREVQDKMVSGNTAYKYNTDYNRFFKDKEFEKQLLTEITEDKIKVFFHGSIKENCLTKGAFKKLYGYVDNTLKKAYREKYITENPMIYFECKQFYRYCEEKEKPIEKQVYSEEEEQKIIGLLHLEYERKPQYIPNYVVELAYLTGMRVGELVALKWEDFHLDEKEPYFVISRSEKYNRMTKEYFIDKTKNQKERAFPVDNTIKDFYHKIHKVQIQNGFICEWMFANEEGRIHAPVVSSCIKNKCGQLGIPKRGIHAFRKTLNSRLRCEGVSEVIMSAILGHSVQVNRTYYTFDTSTMKDTTDIVAKIHTCG